MKNVPSEYLQLFTRNTSALGPSNGQPVRSSAYLALENNLSFLLGNYYPQQGNCSHRVQLTPSTVTIQHYVQLPCVCRDIDVFCAIGPYSDGNTTLVTVTGETTLANFTASHVQADEITVIQRRIQIADETAINTNELALLTLNFETDGENSAELRGWGYFFAPMLGYSLP